ncbi:MAG: protein rep, partial [Oscillospiraceae bacterium]|nr:protein rep [Oscillospiraceae bacterium]
WSAACSTPFFYMRFLLSTRVLCRNSTFLCSWRYGAAWGRILMAVDRYLCEEQQLVPIFVTLTVPNVEVDKLRDTIGHMAASWKRLMQRKDYRVWSNFVRKTEVTYNAKANTYHPHYHVMIWVKPGYFGKSGGYISHDKLLSAWRAATGMSEITQVDVRRCRSAQQEGAAVAEVAKYVAKSSDYLLSQDVFDGFYMGLKGVRIMSLGGEAKKAVQLFRAGKLDKYDPEQPDDLAEYVWRVVYSWTRDGYTASSREAVDLVDEAAACRIHAEIRAADIAAIAQGFSELNGKAYRQRGGREVVSFTPVFSPWEEGDS